MPKQNNPAPARIDDAKQSIPLDLEAIRPYVESWNASQADAEALLAAIDRVQAQCRAWIDEYEAECVRAEDWRRASHGETWHNVYEDQRDHAEAILAAIKGGAA